MVDVRPSLPDTRVPHATIRARLYIVLVARAAAPPPTNKRMASEVRSSQMPTVLGAVIRGGARRLQITHQSTLSSRHEAYQSECRLAMCTKDEYTLTQPTAARRDNHVRVRKMRVRGEFGSKHCQLCFGVRTGTRSTHKMMA